MALQSHKWNWMLFILWRALSLICAIGENGCTPGIFTQQSHDFFSGSTRNGSKAVLLKKNNGKEEYLFVNEPFVNTLFLVISSILQSRTKFEDDDKTVQMESEEEDASAQKEDVEIVKNEDPNKTVLEDDDDEVEDEETVSSKPDFDNDISESDIEDKEGDDDKYEPKDDEFVLDEKKTVFRKTSWKKAPRFWGLFHGILGLNIHAL